MTDKRLFLVLPALALLAACNDAPSDDSRSASGEVLEGTISDAMLPVERVRSEPPLEDPDAFAEAQEKAAAAAPDGEDEPDAHAGRAEPEDDEADEAVVVPPLEPAD